MQMSIFLTLDKFSINIGGTHVICEADVAPPASGQAMLLNFENTGELRLNDDWHETISASGKATLVCRAPNFV